MLSSTDSLSLTFGISRFRKKLLSLGMEALEEHLLSEYSTHHIWRSHLRELPYFMAGFISTRILEEWVSNADPLSKY